MSFLLEHNANNFPFSMSSSNFNPTCLSTCSPFPTIITLFNSLRFLSSPVFLFPIIFFPSFLSLSLSLTLIVSHFSVPINQISQFPSTSFLNFTLSSHIVYNSFSQVTTPFLSPSLKSLSTRFQLSSLHFPPFVTPHQNNIPSL